MNFGNFDQVEVPSGLLRCLPENIWGFLLSTRIDLLIKLMRGSSNLSDIARVNASSTAAEADRYGRHIQNRTAKNSLKLVNTGTIERFCTLWGINQLTHGGQKFLTPYLPLESAGVSERRRDLYKAPKLIFAKMAKHCETFFDKHGEYASLNTNCVYGSRDGISLGFVAGYCNSKLFMFFYDQFFGALRMSGGYYQFQAPQLRVMPFKKPDDATNKNVSALVDRVCAARKRDPKADTRELEREINQLVYDVYGVTEQEKDALEKSVPK